MTLGEKQRAFTRMLGQLLAHAHANGYEITLGEAYRSDEQAEINAMGANGRERFAAFIERMFPVMAYKVRNNTGNGIIASKHCDRLAIDLNLFRDGVYLSDTGHHLPLGVFWESIGGTWGGRFKNADGNHYEWRGP